MTEEENERIADEMIRFQEENPNYWGDQDENGVDLARLRENLTLTPAERLRRMGTTLAFARHLEEAFERNRAAHKRGTSLQGSGD